MPAFVCAALVLMSAEDVPEPLRVFVVAIAIATHAAKRIRLGSRKLDQLLGESLQDTCRRP
jgi:hypothetical protein